MKLTTLLLIATLCFAACGDQEPAAGTDNHTGGGAAAPSSEATVDSLGSQLTPGSATSSDTTGGGTANP